MCVIFPSLKSTEVIMDEILNTKPKPLWTKYVNKEDLITVYKENPKLLLPEMIRYINR